MIVQIKIDEKNYTADLSKPIDISIPMRAGKRNPNCYWAEDVRFETIVAGDFVGSVQRGGSVNYQRLIMTPHGNGTHTETYGHLSADKKATVMNLVKPGICTAEVITVNPNENSNGDSVVEFDDYLESRKYHTDALILRTLPNDESKLNRMYSGTNPPYIDHRITSHLNESGVKHLLVDLPSVDKEIDGGKLLAHRAFWQANNSQRYDCTITELIYVPDNVKDGLYLLDLQTLNLDMDASPSRPILFKVMEY